MDEVASPVNTRDTLNEGRQSRSLLLARKESLLSGVRDTAHVPGVGHGVLLTRPLCANSRCGPSLFESSVAKIDRRYYALRKYGVSEVLKF
jgi:hypothetical protein